jgi:5-hmdU DNA kinase-like protein
VSKWLSANWVIPHVDDPELWHAITLARLCNYPPSLSAIGFPIPWHERREHYLQIMAARRVNGDICYDPAYRPPVSADGIPTAEYHATAILDPLWALRDHLRPRDTLRDFHSRLHRAVRSPEWGGFICAQIVADAKHVPPLKDATDWHTFAVSGPGSRRGLARICGRPVNHDWSETEWLTALTGLRDAILPRLEFELDAQNLQSCLCEVDKFLREKLGEGHPKQIYKPRGPDGGLPSRRKRPRDTSAQTTMLNDGGGGAAPATATAAPAVSIAKPGKFNLDRFKSKANKAIPGGVETLQTALPHYNIAQAKDFVRLHPDEDRYWSDVLSFVHVPIKGQKRETLHLIDDELAKAYLSPKRVIKMRLALATKPFDVFFLCHVPVLNMDNTWNLSNAQACEHAKTLWTLASSRKEDNVDAYKVDFAKSPEAFPPPKWPVRQSLDELSVITFGVRMIDDATHPGLLRLIGAQQQNT